ncbi:benzyl alcohol O-benzoyltransferase-like [Salvia miltiorrhiza]|uniref:benzyl alcohol O-benzoyltransferase-like n=1 Tax=Salvia miltiorrhiza TaxID=226208 RepID=UPI0025AC1677|nr:benzyl alcohol O-benzoyltransferase-like [Salvia miltiorrhiza]
MLCSRHAKMVSSKTLTFKVMRKNLELVSPAESIPYEFKYLSDIDDQDSFRRYFPLINFYEKNPSMEGKDPVKIIRDAVAKALVFYYPLAGRLREYVGRKLVVECTGQGVVFIEADADVMLHHFGDTLYPPFPNLEDLLPHMPNHDDEIINSPLLLIQVTRLKCGGFIIAYLFNHTMCDAAGLFQFLSAVGELACGATLPSIMPVWQRHLLSARHPPRPSIPHPEFHHLVSDICIPHQQMAERSFFFSAADISTLRRSLPPHLQSCSRFEIVAGCAWRCRTIALSPKPDEEVRFLGVVDMRKRMNPPLPLGYYGNALAALPAVTTAEELSKKPLHLAVELVRKAKEEATEEYLRSVADLMVMRGRPPSGPILTKIGPGANYYMVSDFTHGGFKQVDLGWGAAAYGGIAIGVDCPFYQTTWYVSFNNVIVVPVCLPLKALQIFEKQLQMMMMAARTTSAL